MVCRQLKYFLITLSKKILVRRIQKEYIRNICEFQFNKRYSIQDCEEGIILIIESLPMTLFHAKTVNISMESKIDLGDTLIKDRVRNIIRNHYYEAGIIFV